MNTILKTDNTKVKIKRTTDKQQQIRDGLQDLFEDTKSKLSKNLMDGYHLLNNLCEVC